MPASRHRFPPLGLLLFALLVSACSGGSQAASVLESDNISLRATIGFYESLNPTMTAQASVLMQRIATLEAQLAREMDQVRSLTISLNSLSLATPGAALPPPSDPALAAAATGATGPTSAASTAGDFASVRETPTPQPLIVTTPEGGPVSVSGSSGVSLENIVMARSTDPETGCAQEETTTFSASGDAQINVVATANNFASGTRFITRWQGPDGFEETFDWTTDRRGTDMCVYFYVEPRALQMGPASYTVVFIVEDSAGTTESAPITFTLTE